MKNLDSASRLLIPKDVHPPMSDSLGVIVGLIHMRITTKKIFISTEHCAGPALGIQNFPTISKFLVLRCGRGKRGVAGSSAPVHGSGKLSCPFRIPLSLRTTIQRLSVAKLQGGSNIFVGLPHPELHHLF